MNLYILNKNIVFLPKKFYDEGNISIWHLLKETSYFSSYKQINEINIYRILIKYPEYVNYWLRWSENKRSNSGWYFKQDEYRKYYIVGYFYNNRQRLNKEYYSITEACATFIKQEIEDIRNCS